MPKFSCSREIERRYLEKFRHLVTDYELIKDKAHKDYTSCEQLFKAHRMDRRIFNKYYHRYKESGGDLTAFIPRKRGPRFRSRHPDNALEEKVVELRQMGNNRYAISNIVKTQFVGKGLSPTSIYRILQDKNLNRLTPKMKQVRRSYVKERAGQLGHVDCHYLGDKLILGETKKRYVVALMDDATRLVYAEVVDDLRALTIMFSVLRMINIFLEYYGIKFEAILSDNGAEFGRATSTVKSEHPFERMLMELGIKHCYTPPYKPQVNGKIERFWKTLHEDLIEADYDSFTEFKEELVNYCFYYNHERAHQGINHKTPVEQHELLKTSIILQV